MSNVYEAFGEEETVVLTDLLREYLGKFWLLNSEAHGGLLKSYDHVKLPYPASSLKLPKPSFFQTKRQRSSM